MTYIKRTILSVIMLTLCGCKTVHLRGQHISDQAISQLNAQKPNKEQVMELIGTPTFIPEKSQDTWYYIQRTQSQRLWFDPKVVKQRVVKITFAGSNISRAELSEDMQNESLSANSSYTATEGKNMNGAKKFVHNLGRFNKNKKRISNRTVKK